MVEVGGFSSCAVQQQQRFELEPERVSIPEGVLEQADALVDQPLEARELQAAAFRSPQQR